MTPDPEALERARALLEESPRVDASHLELRVEGGTVVLTGAVASPEEATAAAMLVEQELPEVVDDLLIEPSLREGAVDAAGREPAVPPEDEVLVGDPDMLAGPETTVTDDLERALEENEPYDPPDAPHLAPTAAEQRGISSPLVQPGLEPSDELDAEPAEDELPAAADLTAQELRLAGDRPLPALDPELVADPEPRPDPSGREPLGAAPSQAAEDDRFPEPVPGTEPGPGAVGEPTTGGGALGGTPATETGARGADTAAADPTRGASGGVMSDLGQEPGPPVQDDPAVREELPHPD
jgi:hypothetical protein